MGPYFPYIAILITLGFAGLLALWAAEGGRIGRWIGAGLLVGWVLWVGEIVIWRTYPQLLYTPEERVYMTRLGEVILHGKVRVSVDEILPFGTGEVCYVTIGADGLLDDSKAELRRAMGEDVAFDTGLHFLDPISVDYVEPFFVVKRNGKVVVIRDLSGMLSTAWGGRYWLNLEVDGNEWRDPYPFFCGERERMGMRIKRV